jgi:hypothetical protein
MPKLPAALASLVLAAAAAPALVGATDATGGGEPAQARPAATQSESATAPQSTKRSRRLLAPKSRYLIRKINRHRHATWRWQELIGKPRTPASRSARHSRVKAYRKWVFRLWKRRHATVRRQAMNPPHKSAWLCLNRYEGSWTDPGAPYYGGLQMDYGFMRAYGFFLLRRKGPANNWTPVEQMWVAERALRSGRGFYPWPNAARRCGLI